MEIFFWGKVSLTFSELGHLFSEGHRLSMWGQTALIKERQSLHYSWVSKMVQEQRGQLNQFNFFPRSSEGSPPHCCSLPPWPPLFSLPSTVLSCLSFALSGDYFFEEKDFLNHEPKINLMQSEAQRVNKHMGPL